MYFKRYHSLLQLGWRGVFRQKRTLRRAIEHAIAAPCSLGRRTITRSICALNRQRQDWSADYKIFSRSPWEENHLFRPVMKHYLARYKEGPVAVGFDDTKVPKCSRKIPSVFRQRDPMSPAFHTNLILAQRFIQGAVLFPHYREGNHSARAVPVRFRDAPCLKKPKRRAGQAEWKAFRQAQRSYNLSTQTLEVMRDVRNELDEAGACNRPMLSVLDGSFCNRTIFKAGLDRMDLVARCRKDTRLCLPAPHGGRRTYAAEKFSPEQVYNDKSLGWREVKVFYGGTFRKIRCREVNGVLWQRGAATKPLRLMVIAPQPYKLSPNARVNFREPAFLLTTDITSNIRQLLQAYLDRWQIEVNHRDEKSILGVGQAQVHSPKAVPRHPAFLVAAYSMMLLAAIDEFGPNRTKVFVELPKWRRNAKRPSALDLITLLRKQINEVHPSNLVGSKFSENLNLYAYT